MAGKKYDTVTDKEKEITEGAYKIVIIPLGNIYLT
jgi:hypothetical protein